MKKFFVTIIITVTCAVFGASGQSIARFKESLQQPDTLTGAKVEVIEFGEAAEAVAKFDAQALPERTMQGYRIRIYSGNRQSARAEAEAAKSLFEEHYAVPAYFTYENPYFLVTCGDCLTQEEAMMLLRSVRIHFPKAFIVMAEIPTVAIVARPVVKPESEEEGEAAATEGEPLLVEGESEGVTPAEGDSDGATVTPEAAATPAATVAPEQSTPASAPKPTVSSVQAAPQSDAQPLPVAENSLAI